jgi:hypothetical protein
MTRRVVLAGLLAVLVAGCGSQAAPVAPPSIAVRTAPLATSLVTAQGAWAIAVMGGSAASENNFWQLFVRPAGTSRWSLVTPPAVADNGGLVAAGGTGLTSLLVGFRPSQGLAFSPLAMSSDTGKNWTPGLLDAALADVPGALAVGASGRVLALLHDGSIEMAPAPAAAASGQWSRLTTLAALAASAPGRSCGLVALNAVSFGQNDIPMAAGSCQRRGVTGVFADYGGTWQAAGPALPAGLGGDQVQVLGLATPVLANTGGGDVALLLAGTDLLAAWRDGTRWTVSAPVPAAGAITASGFGPGGSVWVLLGGGQAETIAGAGEPWRALPPAPTGTVTLAPPASSSAAASSSGGYDALAVSGSVLTVWRLASAAWAKVQVIHVPIEYGSSS